VLTTETANKFLLHKKTPNPIIYLVPQIFRAYFDFNQSGFVGLDQIASLAKKVG
jgi:hypothetical protein